MPTSPAADAVLTIEPPPLRSIAGMPYFMPRNTPLRCTAICASNVASSTSASSARVPPPKPTLLNSTSRRPNSRSAVSIIAATSSVFDTSVLTATADSPIVSATSRSWPLRSAQTTAHPQREQLRGRGADARARTGDDRHFACEPLAHGTAPPLTPMIWPVT